jgi:AraC family transcriptional regulator of adaptative response / DNA-3-methyladenine glycosylase II
LPELTRLGITAPRAKSIRELARAVVSGHLELQPGVDPELTMTKLIGIAGIGDWTASYIALRALRWPDAFPVADLGLLRSWGAKTPAMLRDDAEIWRPWRGYAAMHLWNSDV